MRETLIYLTHLNPDDMDQMMLSKLSEETRFAQNPQNAAQRWSPTNLNRLCYAIGYCLGFVRCRKGVVRMEKRTYALRRSIYNLRHLRF